MKDDITYCGYDCSKCAARSEDPTVRQRLVDAWRKFFGHEMYTVENVKCSGCKSDGKLADTSCQVRPCAIAKGIETCAKCAEFPCRKVAPLISNRDALLLYCHRQLLDSTEAEFEFASAAFSCSLDNLLDVLRENGKLPDWAKK